ncbi:MAG: 16S rRNA (guanine(966)-N(2))-methyltransferase RsmD [Candidatus Eisenbacteria bacterium]|uniref:16S rRNA (Guanine(966)-N(2))-methyltransferase RsmD n=1 Tax=Eiseniibacteriota bacterium TaxID=2212470 RepID=A0A538TA00_UNCEI|nr:MAG: 16S rRNA (guanine(966)-N(2))-methyltransferase RsmD [Candidatus Eisenbacteria bacterium]
MGFVRIVGGDLRGRRIRVPDRGVRPTAARTREAVFDVLGPRAVQRARVLDLYAGTGALGIEALSRGAAEATFLERNRAVARALRENLARLGLSDRASVQEADLSRVELPPGVLGPFDLVFLDPPYEGGAGPRWLERLADLPWPEEGGLVVYERQKGTEAREPPAFQLATERTYSDTTVAFYRARCK